jgi:hypothetical protein
MKAIYITWGECTFLSRRLPIAGFCPWFGPAEFLMLRYSPCRGYFMVVQEPSFHHLLSSPTFYTMAMLATMHREILCLSCDQQVITAWKSYIVCTHAFGTGSFLSIGASAEKVKAAVCTIYAPCLSKMTSKKRTWRNHDERQSSSSHGANCKELYGKWTISLLRHWKCAEVYAR